MSDSENNNRQRRLEKMEQEQPVKKRGRPAKPKAVEVKEPEKVIMEIEQPTEEPEVVTTDKPTIESISEPLEDTIIVEKEVVDSTEDIPNSEDTTNDIFSVEELDDDYIERDPGLYSLNYKYRRGDTVWVANWGRKLESTSMYGLAQEVWKYRPLKLKVKGFTYEGKIIYKFFGSGCEAEESHIKLTLEACQMLCDGLNSK